MSPKSRTIAHITASFLLALTMVLTANGQSVKAGKLFAAPDEAANALFAAAKADNQAAALEIFGPDSKDLIDSGDPVQDKNSIAAFAKRYEEMHRWRKAVDGSQVLVVGYDNFPFPIPLKKNDSGQWFFDTAAGKEEVLNRRVGRNELSVIDVCDAIFNAQMQYFAQKHGGVGQYATKFISDSGQQNGLYWPEVAGQPRSPLGPMAAFATAEGYKADPNHHQPFHGYYFVLLDKQGSDAKGGPKSYLVDGKMTAGFAALAYPAKYGDSGVMTFIVNQDGVVFQKDLGKSTEEIAPTITEFNPDKSWSAVK